MNISITKKFKFEAAHNLPDHPGRCKSLHGHSYKLEVTVSAREMNEQGMVMDFGDLKKSVNKHVINLFDHSYLNDYFSVPTAENMAKWIFLDLSVYLSEEFERRVKLKKVRLYETEDSYAEVSE